MKERENENDWSNPLCTPCAINAQLIIYIYREREEGKGEGG